MNARFHAIEPLDVLFLRGNKLFAAAGDSSATMPPWPSTLSGALRTQLLVSQEGALEQFIAGRLEGEAGKVLGAGPDRPGTFRLAGWSLMTSDGRQAHPLPGDLQVVRTAKDETVVRRLKPTDVANLSLRLGTPAGLDTVPVLQSHGREKPATGFWIDEAGLSAHLAGNVPPVESLVNTGDLWASERRLGIARTADTGTASDGMLYTSEVVALRPGVSFLTAVVGTGDRTIPAGVLRLGGDGRGAAIRDFATASDSSWPSSGRPAGKRFAISLASPCPSPRGWLLPGMRQEDDGSVLFESSGIRARLRGVALPRYDVISGWDLARRAPKPAQRMAPTGAVYWLESLGDSPLALGELEKEGILNEDAISGLPEAEQGALRQRAAEGFGAVWIGCWPGEGR